MRSRSFTFAVWALAAVVLVAYPVIRLVRLSFREDDGSIGLGNYAQALGESSLIGAAWTSMWTATATTAGCLIIGVPLAFLVSRTDMPLKRFVRATSVMTFVIPNFIAVLGWILLLAPRSGLLNQPLQAMLGTNSGPFNIFSGWGIVFCLTVLLFPLIFLPTAAALDNLEVPLEHAASSLGAGKWTVYRKITLPLIMPAVYAGSVLVFTVSFVAFGPTVLLGGPAGYDNIATAMLDLTRFPPRIEMAAVMGVPTLVVLAVLLYLQRVKFGNRSFSIISGKPGQRSIVNLGLWRIPVVLMALGVFAVTVLLPFGILFLTAVRGTMGHPIGFDNIALTENFRGVFAQRQVGEAFRNSLVLALAASVIGIVVALLGAWLVERARSRKSAVVAPTMLVPLAFPGSILGIALIIAYGAGPAGLSGTLTILLIAYVIGNLPLAFTYVHAGLKQVDASLEEAARSLGASWVTTFRKVTLPLLRGPVLVVAVLTFILQFRDLDSSIFLFNGNNPVVAVVILNLAEASLYQLVSALSVVILCVNIAAIGLIAIIGWIRRRMAARRERPNVLGAEA